MDRNTGPFLEGCESGAYEQSLGWDALRSAEWLGTRISSGVSWFRWQSVEAVSPGFREAGSYVTRTKAGTPRASRGRLPNLLPTFRS